MEAVTKSEKIQAPNANLPENTESQEESHHPKKEGICNTEGGKNPSSIKVRMRILTV
jgi:hypothetical protein